MPPLISIVTINYRGLSDTCKLIESIDSFFSPGVKSCSWFYEIIVVDNDAQSKELEIIKSRYPSIIAVQNRENSGFAAGNNLGLEHSKGEYLLFINNDVQFRDTSFKYLVERLLSSSNIAGVSPKILSLKDGKTIQYAGYTPLSTVTMRNKTIGLGEIDEGKYNEAHTVPYIHGAAFLVKRSVLEKVGKWPEVYFLYYEELDLSERIRQLGYELWYEPSCTVYHSGSASIGINSPLQVFYMTRNRLIFARRNFSKIKFFLSSLYQFCIAIPKQCIKFAARGKFNLVLVSLKACFSFGKEGKVNI